MPQPLSDVRQRAADDWLKEGQLQREEDEERDFTLDGPGAGIGEGDAH
jgi:hypothetical protein